MLSKIRNSKLAKWLSASVVASMVAVMGCLTCFAADGSTVDLSSSLSTAFTNIKNDIFSYIVVALPIALAVVGAFFGISAAIKFFKRSAK